MTLEELGQAAADYAKKHPYIEVHKPNRRTDIQKSIDLFIRCQPIDHHVGHQNHQRQESGHMGIKPREHHIAEEQTREKPRDAIT